MSDKFAPFEVNPKPCTDADREARGGASDSAAC